MNGRGPTTRSLGDVRSPWLLTTYKSWDDPPSDGGSCWKKTKLGCADPDEQMTGGKFHRDDSPPVGNPKWWFSKGISQQIHLIQVRVTIFPTKWSEHKVATG